MLIRSKLDSMDRLFNEIDEEYREIALRFGLTDSTMWVLYYLCENKGECMLSDIVSSTNISKQTINSALRKLESEEVLYLEMSGAKKKKVCLTKKGIELAEASVVKLIKAENRLYDSWDREEYKTYLRLTQKFLQDFKKETEIL